MAAPDQVYDINEPVQHEDPGEEEVPAPAHRQILLGRKRRPGGKAALLQVAVLVARGAQEAGRFERMPEYRRHAGSRIAIVVLAGREREERLVEIGLLPPGQRRIGVEN